MDKIIPTYIIYKNIMYVESFIFKNLNIYMATINKIIEFTLN